MTAFAFGKPMIATQVGGLPEMVRHEHYGLIIKEKDINTLADAITLLWKHPEKVKSYSNEIKQSYDTGELSWKKIAEDMIKIYK